SLRDMPGDERLRELRDTLWIGTTVPRRPPRLCQSQWNLGTIFTYGGESCPLSAWHAALIAEARRWMSDGLNISRFSATPGWMPAPCGPIRGKGRWGMWFAPTWLERMPIRNCERLFRPRKKHTPATWNYYLLRENPRLRWRIFEIGTYLGSPIATMA